MTPAMEAVGVSTVRPDNEGGIEHMVDLECQETRTGQLQPLLCFVGEEDGGCGNDEEDSCTGSVEDLDADEDTEDRGRFDSEVLIDTLIHQIGGDGSYEEGDILRLRNGGLQEVLTEYTNREKWTHILMLAGLIITALIFHQLIYAWENVHVTTVETRKQKYVIIPGLLTTMLQSSVLPSSHV